MDLGPIVPKRLSGNELFYNAEQRLNFDLLDFWRWSSSDLAGNTARGILAEYIVGRAIGCNLDVRNEWASYDLETEDIRIEVKSAAYIQSWFQRQFSKITFGYAKRHAWDEKTGRLTPESQRHADVYVFSLLSHQDKATLNPMDMSQWEFYVVTTAWLNARERSQNSITISSLRKNFTPVKYSELKDAVSKAAGK